MRRIFWAMAASALLAISTASATFAQPAPDLQGARVTFEGDAFTLSGAAQHLKDESGWLSVDALVRVVCVDGSGSDWGVRLAVTLSGKNRQEFEFTVPAGCEIARAELLSASVTTT